MIGRLENGGHHTMIKDRFLGFLIWQSFQSTLVYFLAKTLFLPSTTTTIIILSFFFFFHLSLLLFSSSLFLVSSPQPVSGVSPVELFFGLLRLVFVYGGQPLPPDFRRRARVTLRFLFFVGSSAVSAYLAVLCLCGGGALGLRGLLLGLIYGSHYVFTRRWVLDFPILQRPPFFSYKMGVQKAVVKAISLSSAGYLVSLVVPIFISDRKETMRDLILEQIVFYFASCVLFLCWELNRHLLQVFLTRRYMFAPPKGSAAAATNPSDHLLAALENTTERSFVHHLAYLDLCMVSESNVDTWRRAAFFEETGETYKKVIAVCLKPLEQLTLDLTEGLGSSLEKSTFQLSHQLHSSAELSSVSGLHEPFYDFQVCAWSARIVSSLTIRSHKEDRLGVAQLSGCNAATITTLLSCLLAVETLMGKKTNLQPSNAQYPANIKWAALSPTTATTVGIIQNKKDSPHYAKAYSMADILRTSIYQIVSNFHHEMITSSKNGLLEKDWISNGKPLYGSRELILHKLRMFLEFQAN
ncbi:putative nucleoporin protein Ndc1-Nup [Helianthus debilis subsp. tardiflorus]